MNAARIIRVKEPLETQTLETPKPIGLQVLIKSQPITQFI
jgi:alcohol dehydrogenase, propanol-preferring